MILLASAILALLAASAPADRPVSLDETANPAEVRDRFRTDASAHVVNIWATWCAPCVAEMRDLQDLDTRYSPRGVEFIGVSTDDVIPGDREKTKARVRRFLASTGISFRNVYFTGRIESLQDEFNFEGEIPITIVYDRQGRESYRVQGRLDRGKLEAVLRHYAGAPTKETSK